MISLLPNHIANQIAAGEVIQRPSSVVKELFENAIDAKSNFIKLLIIDSGKTIIQVIDDGIGMDDIDAKMCFKRHATSKISKTDDLLSLTTKGFRGEALASIAAIAQIDLKTRKANQELGTYIYIEGSEIKLQEFCTCQKGTSITIKNLFYNVPARRKFLKSDNTEFKLITEEFIRISIAHPEIRFSMFHNEKEIYRLSSESKRKRLVNLYGKNYNNRLVPVKETTDIVKISGFVCKPEFFKKSRREQFFYVNNRFIKSSYLNHAVQNAMEGLIQVGYYPSFFLFLDLDPSKIDVNIHPTKTEIKFEDEKHIYAILLSSIKHSIGLYNIAPSLDFSLNPKYNIILNTTNKNTKLEVPNIKVDPSFNPFDKTNKKNSSQKINSNIKGKDWKALFEEIQTDMNSAILESPSVLKKLEEEVQETPFVIQVNNQFIFTQIKSGILIIEQEKAHERILYERYSELFTNSKVISQSLLFPKEVYLNKIEMNQFKELKNYISSLGFKFNIIDSKICITGTPIEIKNESIDDLIIEILHSYDENNEEWKVKQKKSLAKIFARKNAIKSGKNLQIEEMKQLIDKLFACKMPFASISSNSTAIVIEYNTLIKKFN